MSTNAKRAILALLGGLGLILLLIGAIAHVYDTSIGVILTLVCWIAAGVLGRLWGIKERKGRER